MSVLLVIFAIVVWSPTSLTDGSDALVANG
jgi:hypothetical protein